MNRLKPLNLLDEQSTPPLWKWYTFRMPDGLDNTFRAPDLETARKWATEQIMANRERELINQEHLLETRKRMAAAEALYAERLAALYDKNLQTGTFADVDDSFHTIYNDIEIKQSNSISHTSSKTKKNKTSSYPSFIELLDFEN